MNYVPYIFGHSRMGKTEFFQKAQFLKMSENFCRGT